MKIVPYLMFNGQCAEAFKFYEQCLDAKIEFLQTHGDSPAADQTPPELHDLVLHARLVIGDQVLMGSDSPPQYAEEMGGFHVSLQVDDPDEAERIFNDLAEGGTVKMEFQQTFWAKRFGMLIDRFGTPWMVNCD